MKLTSLAVLSTSVVSLLTFACSLKIEAPDDPVSIDVKSTKPTKPVPEKPSTPSPPIGSAVPVGPTPSEPAPSVPATCGSLAADAKPEGSFKVTAGTLAFKDVFITERTFEGERKDSPEGAPYHYFSRSLQIAFTDTLHECKYFANGLTPHDMSQSRINVSIESKAAMPPEIGPGTYGKGAGQSVSNDFEGGARCQTSAEIQKQIDETGGVSFIGTAIGASFITGTVTITKRTATWVEGSFDIVSFDGKRTAVTFSAPICPRWEAQSSTWPSTPVCCDPTRP